jgi:3-hydroxyisobutyrate dehydrogenase
MNPAKDTIGFIGTGVMGRSMAGHLLSAGYTVRIYTRTKEKARELLDRGGVWADTPATVAAASSCIFTMVGYPTDVEEVYFGSTGVIENAKPGTFIVDTTTSKPELAIRIAAAAAKRGLKALDAPVSGGDMGAKNATLTIMVGGAKEDFEAVKPLLEIMGKTVVLQGGPGSGQHTKMANQIAIAGSLLGTAEALIYAKKAGLDPETVLSSIGAGSAGSWQLNNLGPKMLAGDFAPGFYAKHFLKDLGIALEAAREMKLDLPLVALAERLFQTVKRDGLGEKGTQALYLLYGQGQGRGQRPAQ